MDKNTLIGAAIGLSFAAVVGGLIVVSGVASPKSEQMLHGGWVTHVNGQQIITDAKPLFTK